MKKIGVGCVILVILLIGGIFFGQQWYKKQIDTPNSDSSGVIEVEILPGSDVKTIAKTLKDKGVISNPDVFYWYVKIEKLGPSIQAGKFLIPKNLNMIDVVKVLQKAAGDDIWISFQEGLRMDEISATLQIQFAQIEGSQFDADEFNDIIENPDNHNLSASILKYKPAGNSLEGMLFPDTYNVKRDITSQELVDLFLQTFEEKMTTVINTLLNSQEGVYGSLVLASIVEREGRTDEERPYIAEILLTRLHEGVEDGTKLLQTDATLLYLQKDWVTPVTEALKQEDNPYNTYLYPGLPPTPISNPGLESILAVANPQSNDFLYYLHGNDGVIHYGKTFAEHDQNQQCYILENNEFCP